MKDVEIGMVTGPLGIRGEVKIKSYAEDPSRFKKIKEIGLRIKGKDACDYTIEHARISGGMVVVKLAGVDDRNAAELLRNAEFVVVRIFLLHHSVDGRVVAVSQGVLRGI